MRDGYLAPHRLGLSRQIIDSVIKRRKIHSDDFFDGSREPFLVAARREAARLLFAEGFNSQQIARRLKRDHTTVLNYLPKMEEAKKARRAARIVTRKLSDGAHHLVIETAKRQGITAEELIARWVEERAQFEMQRKAVAA
jgi:transposase